MTDITADQFIEAVRQVAALSPDYIDVPPCRYVRRGQAGCIMGTAAWNLNLIGPEFQYGDFNAEGVETFLNHLGIFPDGVQSLWLDTVQDAQDCGSTWGNAIACGDNALLKQLQSSDDEEDEE